MNKQKIIVSVTNDLTTDQRADKICNTLSDLGYDILLIGRYFKNSQFLYRNYETKRFKLWFNKGPLFYANYNLRLFVYLIWNKPNALWSNDLDSLPCNYLYSTLKKDVKLIFDSHEYFTEVPELYDKPLKKGFWKFLEKSMLPKIKYVLTVSQSIANLYEKEYNIKVKLLRNVPLLDKEKREGKKIKVEGKKVLIYQGAVNINRGIEKMVKAMLYIDNSILYIAGSGDISKDIIELIDINNLSEKVIMLGRIPFEDLHNYTSQADLGLSLEEDAGLNYRFALPNKVFDYIQAGIPVLVSDLPEMKNLIEQHQIGETINNAALPKDIASKISDMLDNEEQIAKWKSNTKIASKELNWEKEVQFLQDFLNESK